ncbi:UDP-glucose 4-epimerase GalE [Marinomonas sp. 15G1-11]|uniref:UDP-glucose 4-epimerase n=1 Tax=Marinomonas phaeophyticola TaxID=3004091 RepID=A0ABT4JSK2_9GAMM|nr:UDP-glucose 4-epimerase GalE [Marinomonas sp. 15G1-11]MCZ2721327.1 UDP-glucose 4-epimerase GalE [Marinomonas sp. 15G1-11]
MKTILVTGGMGFIGSHVCVSLLEQNQQVIIVDNLANSNKEVISRIQKITGKAPLFYPVDLLDEEALSAVFKRHNIEAVIHFAALKAVGESARVPLSYYHNNVTGSLVLFRVMEKYQVFNLVFSSSATVYGEKNPIPYVEHFPLSATNPYGRTKVMIEEILQDTFKADARWNISLLRYFNPIGAHPSGLIGEDPNGIPNNLMPYIAQVAVGKRDALNVFGDDYPTPDGTGVRDYIHVVDLALGHLKALDNLFKTDFTSISAYNLGAGKGYSVLDVVHAFEKVSSKKINYVMSPRREGDIAEFYADATKAQQVLDWKVERSLEDMCRDTWNWQSKNPNGYGA